MWVAAFSRNTLICCKVFKGVNFSAFIGVTCQKGGVYASYLPVRLELNVLSFLARDGGSNPKGVNVNTHCLMIFADLDLFHVLLPYRFMGVLSQK